MNLPILHVVVTDAVASRTDFLPAAVRVLAAGGEHVALHLRLREATDRGLFDTAVELEERTIDAGAWLVVNRRIDVALGAGADAVQLGRGAVPVSVARHLAEGALAIGASVHDVAGADLARRHGADYLVAGSVYETASHPGLVPAGVELIAALRTLPLPVIAIGGLTPERAGEVRRAGADGVAAIRSIWEAPNPADVVQQYLIQWNEA